MGISLLFYYFICTENETKKFESDFNPTSDQTYVEGYSKSSSSFYCRTLILTFDIPYYHNKNNVYPLPILFSDMITNTKPKK